MATDEHRKRCPFCRSDQTVIVHEIWLTIRKYRVRCCTCEALGPASVAETGAVSWWNTRDGTPGPLADD